MTGKDLISALNDVEHEMVEDAGKKKASRWLKYGTAAACLLVVLGLLGALSWGYWRTNYLPVESGTSSGPLYYGDGNSDGGGISAMVTDVGVSVTAKPLEQLPDSYTFYDDLQQTAFCLLRVETVTVLKGKRVPEELYLVIPEGFKTDFMRYDLFGLVDLMQCTYEVAVIYNKTQNCAEQIHGVLFGFSPYTIVGNPGGDMMAFREDGGFDGSLWNATEAWRSATKDAVESLDEEFDLETFEELERQAADRLKRGISVTYLADVEGEAAEAVKYATDLRNGVYSASSYNLLYLGPTVQMTARRYLNGFATNETVYVCGGYSNGKRTEDHAEYSKAKFTEEDLGRLPNLRGAVEAVKKGFDEGLVVPPHIEGYQEMKLRGYGIFGWYAKTEEGVLGIVQVNFCYGRHYDDAYYVTEYGADSCYLIERDELLELLGEYETDFIYDGAYNELGKDRHLVVA